MTEASILVLIIPLALAGCPKKGQSTSTGDGGTPSSLTTTLADATVGAPAGGVAEGPPGDGGQSVYPGDANVPADPVAAKLCAGLTEMPEKKRAVCCGAAPAVVTTSECTRVLSAAVGNQAV